jgi:hypothetical protein
MRSSIAAGIFVLLIAIPSLGGPPPVRPKHSPITAADRAFWSFQQVKQVAVPKAAEDGWCRNPIDALIVLSLREHGLVPSKQADRVTLIRRATFDLHGLPPTPAEVDAFVNDPSSDAYEKLIDRLLASPRYGERMARQWLDLVRYAESDGFKQDTYRPNAWRYRDYVIRSFNDDKPYDRFVTEQLAGDEIAPDDPDVIVATGYLRHWPYEYNQRDVPKQWADILSDITDVTGDALLGLSVGCAKCHDHKFDPILQSDYYRLEAFFAPMLPRDDVPLASASERAEFAKKQAAWERKTAVLRAEIAAIEAPFIRRTAEMAVMKFPPETQAILAAPPAGRTPLEQQWAWLANRQVYDPDENPPVKIDGKKDPALKERYESLKKELAAMDTERPTPLAKGQVVGDIGPVAPPTYLPGNHSNALEPGTPVVLDETACKLPPIVPTASSTGRRTALAKWITDPANPLTARVMVNRIWQSHFGRGLVGTSSDFGRLGERPSHPELLDWLANQFVSHSTSSGQARGWSLKQMHRLIMTSAAYRQASEGSPCEQIALASDPENRLVWRMSPRRLEAEQVRDAMLAVSGELSCDAGGAPVDAKVPRRSIYTKAMRNTRDRLLDAFDAPESFCSVAARNCTTTASQSLLLLNGEWPLKRAEAFATRVRRDAETSDPSAQVGIAYRLAYGRPPSADECNRAGAFVTRENGDAGLVDLCHVLLSSNEFLYVY